MSVVNLNRLSKRGRRAETSVTTIMPPINAELTAIKGSMDIKFPLNRVIHIEVNIPTRLTDKPALQMAERFLHLMTPKAAVSPVVKTNTE
jgi:hypothetical protein